MALARASLKPKHWYQRLLSPAGAALSTDFVYDRLNFIHGHRLVGILREYKCVYVLNDEEIGLFSDEVVVNCAP